MHSLGDLVRSPRLRPDGTGGGWLGARHFELVHSAKVVGPRLRPPADATGPQGAPLSRLGGAGPNSNCDYLVSVLREGWDRGRETSRLRLTHTAHRLGPLEAIITGLPVPQVIRLRGGDVSPYREVRAVPVELEIRRLMEPHLASSKRER